jgi:hypothetical protein
MVFVGTKQGRVKGLRRNEADRRLTNNPVLAKMQSTFPISFEEGRLLVNGNSETNRAGQTCRQMKDDLAPSLK